MTTPLPKASLIAFGLLTLWGCPGKLEAPERFRLPPTSCKLTIDVEADLLRPRCGTAGCHAAVTPIVNLDFETPGVLARTTDVQEVGCTGRALASKASPRSSVILDRLKPTPSCASRMPLVGEFFNQDEIDCVEVWLVESLTGTTAQALEAER